MNQSLFRLSVYFILGEHDRIEMFHSNLRINSERLFSHYYFEMNIVEDPIGFLVTLLVGDNIVAKMTFVSRSATG